MARILPLAYLKVKHNFAVRFSKGSAIVKKLNPFSRSYLLIEVNNSCHVPLCSSIFRNTDIKLAI